MHYYTLYSYKKLKNRRLLYNNLLYDIFIKNKEKVIKIDCFIFNN